MTAADVIIILILLAVVGLATAYIIKEKKRGAKCIGCPYSKTCSHHCSEQKSKTTPKK